MSGMESTCPCGLLLDPYVFVKPTAQTAEEVRRYFFKLVAWARALRSREAATSGAAVDELRATGMFPDFEWTKRTLQQLGIEELTAVDVHLALRVLADRAPYAEERLGFRDVSAIVSTDPALVLNRLPDTVSTALAHVFVEAIYWCQRNESPLPIVGTTEVPVNELRVTGSMDLLEHVGGQLEEPLKQTIDEFFALVQDPEILNLDASDHVAAILRACASCAIGLGGNLANIRLGERFKDSLDRHGFTTQKTLLAKLYRTCALAALGCLAQNAGARLHPVRESEAADSPQVVRGLGDRKWRCMLTKSGAGYRLHYWECTDGAIEFDEVLVESEV
jgi:hypothetical protein